MRVRAWAATNFMVVSNSSSANDERGNLEKTRSALLRQLAKHFLAGLDHLPFALLRRFLVEATAFDLGEDARLFALALETTQCLLEGFVIANVNSCRHWRSHPLSVQFAQTQRPMRAPGRRGYHRRVLPVKIETHHTAARPQPVNSATGSVFDHRRRGDRFPVLVVDLAGLDFEVESRRTALTLL